MEEKNQSLNGQGMVTEPDPEVVVMTRRRQYSREYKRRILAEAEQCQHGEVGALLRREGLYYATLSKWRQQQAAGKLDGRREKQQEAEKEQAQELKRLEGENVRLQAQLAKAEAIIEVQKKLSVSRCKKSYPCWWGWWRIEARGAGAGDGLTG
jgi:transposase-like protein